MVFGFVVFVKAGETKNLDTNYVNFWLSNGAFCIPQLKLKRLQREREEQSRNGVAVNSVDGQKTKGNSTSVAFLRAKKDLLEYQDMPGITIDYQNNNPMQIELTIRPDQGYYRGGIFHFRCNIPEEYPNLAPEFYCVEKIYHPNIDIDGHVCLNILRSDWKPTLRLQLVFAGILHLFLEPNPNDPLNKEAANDLARFPDEFRRHVTISMGGGYVGNEKFSRIFGLYWVYFLVSIYTIL